jgi:hypothetical protein
VTVRHPYGFTESLSQLVKEFDFTDLLRLDRLDARPDLANANELSVHEPQPILDQAALLWAVVCGFAARYYLAFRNTVFMRQGGLVLASTSETDRMLKGICAKRCAQMDPSPKPNLMPSTSVDSAEKSGSYVQRDAPGTANEWTGCVGAEEIQCVMARVAQIATPYGYTTDRIMKQGAA